MAAEFSQSDVGRANRIVIANLRLAYKWASTNAAKAAAIGIDAEEFKSLAMSWLVEASRSYDETRGANFSTWAYLVMNSRLRHEWTKSRSARCGGGKIRTFNIPRDQNDKPIDLQDISGDVIQIVENIEAKERMRK